MRMTLLAMGILLVATTGYAAERNPLSEFAKSASKDAESQLLLGDLYREAGQYEKAKRAYKQARIKDPVGGRLGLIQILMAKQNFRNAKAACRKMARDYQKAPVGEMCSGWFWLSNGRLSRAIEEFEKAIKKGDVAGGKLGIAEAKRMNREWDESIAAYNASISAFEKAGASKSTLTGKRYKYLAYLGKGLALEQQGNTAVAVQSLSMASKAQPASCLARFHNGRLIGAGPQATKELEAAIAMRPDWLQARMALGNAYEKAGNHKSAADTFQAAIDANKQLGEPYFGLAKAKVKLGKLDEALASLKTLTQIIPNHAGAYLLQAEIYAGQKNADAAIEALDRARDVASGDVEVFIRSAQIYMNVGRYTNARAFLNQALSMKPNISRVHAMLGKIACQRRRYDEGRGHYAKALEGDLVGVTKQEITKQQSKCKK